MAQIFVSHSQRDTSIKKFFVEIFSVSTIKGVFKEIEGFSTIPSFEIQRDIENSQTVFLLLGPHLNELKHTRDWVVWEMGVASEAKKEIWVFEPLNFYGKIDIIVPQLSHYVPYRETNEFKRYIKSIIESYDDVPLLKSVLRGGTIGGLLKGLEGAVIGSLADAILTDPSRKRPIGFPVRCNKCKSLYRLHFKIRLLRCPVCNAILELIE